MAHISTIDDKELLRRLALIREPKRLEVIAGVLGELKRDSAAAYED